MSRVTGQENSSLAVSVCYRDLKAPGRDALHGDRQGRGAYSLAHYLHAALGREVARLKLPRVITEQVGPSLVRIESDYHALGLRVGDPPQKIGLVGLVFGQVRGEAD